MDELITERELLKRIRTEGILAAYEAALAVCRDTKAPAPARATASGVLFRVAGLFNTSKDDAARKEAHEMTADEIDAEIRRLKGDFRAPAPGIFD